MKAYEIAVNEADIVSITDLAGRIVYVNENFITISQYSKEELIGKNHRLIKSGEHSREFFSEMWHTISKGKHWRGEIKNKAKDGSYYWVDTTITPVFDDENRIYQYLSIRNLISTQKENEEKLIRYQAALLKREDQLKDAQRIAKTGSWYLDIAANSLNWSDETYSIFEIPPGTPVSYADFLTMVHPDDKENVHQSWQRAIRGEPYDIEHRIRTARGEKWVRENAHLEFNKLGILTGGVGVIQDVTEKRKTEESLRQSEILYRSLFDNSPFPIAIIDTSSLKFLMVNQAAEKLYGYPATELLQLTAYDIRIAEEHEQMNEQLKSRQYTTDNSYRSHKTKSGSVLKVEPFITMIDFKGREAYLVTINDITEKLRAREDLVATKLRHQNDVVRAAMEAQEKERGVVGRELHDNINQLLVASNLYLKNIKPASDADRELLNKSTGIIREAITEIRTLSWTLVPPSLKDLSLEESLRDLSENFKVTTTLVEFDIDIREELLQEGLKLNIYRIIQEHFNNIIKYADATKVKVILRQEKNTVTLEITDNGKGFDPHQKPKGIGFANIIHRAEVYAGKVVLSSSPGNGCKILINFNLGQTAIRSRQSSHYPRSS